MGIVAHHLSPEKAAEKKQPRQKALRGSMPLDTKVRWKGIWMISILINLLFVNNAIASGPKCNKTPPTQGAPQTRGDMGSRLSSLDLRGSTGLAKSTRSHWRG